MQKAKSVANNALLLLPNHFGIIFGLSKFVVYIGQNSKLQFCADILDKRKLAHCFSGIFDGLPVFTKGYLTFETKLDGASF